MKNEWMMSASKAQIQKAITAVRAFQPDLSDCQIVAELAMERFTIDLKDGEIIGVQIPSPEIPRGKQVSIPIEAKKARIKWDEEQRHKEEARAAWLETEEGKEHMRKIFASFGIESS
ncbi:MAG: hypothetical protein Q8K86_10665 [Candidatus Nanopelagicaceae bacterium]|nr:hypothetical protein [Candidatus Nanopelagicaceae bacterium]